MGDKAIEFRIGYCLDEPIFENTFTLKDDTNLKTLYTKLCLLLANHIELEES